MTQQELFKNLTSSAEASPANRSVSQANKKARKTIDTSGHTCMQLLNQRNPLGSLSKTLVASSMWHSMMCVLTWKPKVTPRNRLLFQLAVSKLPTKETESGSSENYGQREFEKPLVDTDSIRPHEHKTTEEESSRRGSETSTTTTSNDVANAQSNGEDGVLRTTESEHDQGDTRMESSSSSDGRSERGISQDVADPKLVSSDSISDSGSNTKTESEQGQKTGNLDRSSGRQDVPNTSSQRLEGHRGEHGLRGTSQEEQTSRSSEEQDVPNPKELRNYEHDNGERTQQDREHRVSQQPRGERGFEGTKQDVADTERLGQQGQGELERPGNTAQDSDGQTGGSNDGRQGSTGQGHTQSELGGVADGIPTRLDGHLGFEREPNIPRVATGIPDRVNRLKALGNSIVPQIVYNIGLAILEEEKRTNVTK
jgi:hypothetical protein